MHDQRIVGQPVASVRVRTVSGLGVCDVWRLELTEDQWPWLADELDEARGPLEESLLRARAEDARNPSAETEHEVTALEYELRLVRLMRAQLPNCAHEGAVIFTGPAELVRELVASTLRDVVSALSDAVELRRHGDRVGRGRLIAAAEAAAAWAKTLDDCEEVETFSVDPRADPVLLR